MEKVLNNYFYRLPQSSAYAGAYNLLNKINKNRKRKRIIEWLETQDAYTLHKPVRRHFPHRTYDIYNPFDLWEADLVDLRSLKTYNDNYTYLLVVIDVLSKFAWVQPLHDKSSKSVAKAFEHILTQCKGQHPVYLQTDKGKEFIGKEMQKVLKKNNIAYRVVRNPDIKAAVVERFNRTLKSRLWRYFTHKNTYRYIDVLQKIVHAYNDSWHLATKMVPASVNLYNAAKARQNLAQRYKVTRTRLPKYKVGDLVRVSRANVPFKKAYEGGWTLELFRIKRVSTDRQPPVYSVEDLQGEVIDGFFYEEELSRVRKDLNEELFAIDKILKTKGAGKNKKYFVSWKGYPDKFNSWVPTSNIKKT